jgi:hypothetical protein
MPVESDAETLEEVVTIEANNEPVLRLAPTEAPAVAAERNTMLVERPAPTLETAIPVTTSAAPEPRIVAPTLAVTTGVAASAIPVVRVALAAEITDGVAVSTPAVLRSAETLEDAAAFAASAMNELTSGARTVEPALAYVTIPGMRKTVPRAQPWPPVTKVALAKAPPLQFALSGIFVERFAPTLAPATAFALKKLATGSVACTARLIGAYATKPGCSTTKPSAHPAIRISLS